MDPGDPDYSGDEDIHDRDRLIEEFRFLREKNNNYSFDKCWNLNKPFYGRADLPPDLWLLTKDATSTKEFIASYFYELLSSREPMSIDELLDNWEVAIDEYPEFQEITMKPGFPGIIKYLIESYRFVLINDYISVADKVAALESQQLEETIECLEFHLAESASLIVNYAPEHMEERPDSSRSSGCTSGAGEGTPFDDLYIGTKKHSEQEKLKTVVNENRVKTPIPDNLVVDKIKPPTTPVKVRPDIKLVVKQELPSPEPKSLENIPAFSNSLKPAPKKKESTSFIFTNIPNATVETGTHRGLDFSMISIPLGSLKKNKDGATVETKADIKEKDSYAELDAKLKGYMEEVVGDKNKGDKKQAKPDKASADGKKCEAEVKATKEKKEKKAAKLLAEESKVVKVVTEEKKVVKSVVEEKKVVKVAVEVKKPAGAVKKAEKNAEKLIELEVGTCKVEKAVQTDVHGDHYDLLEIRLDRVTEENKLMQKRVENADEITMVLLDNRKKAQAQMDSLTQEKLEAEQKHEIMVQERDIAVRASEVAAQVIEKLKAEVERYKKQCAVKSTAQDVMKRAYFLTQRELVSIRRDLCHLTYEETMNQLQVALSYPRLPPAKRDQLRAMREELGKLQRSINDSNAEVLKLYDHVSGQLDEVEDIGELPKVGQVEVPPHMLTALLDVQTHFSPGHLQPQGLQNMLFPRQPQHNMFYPRMPPPAQLKGLPNQGMPNQGIAMPNQGVPIQNQGVPTQNRVMPVQNQGMPTQNRVMPVQNQGMPTQNRVMPMQNQGIPMQNQGMPRQNQGMRPYGTPQQNHAMMMHNRRMFMQNHGMTAHNHAMPHQNHVMAQQNLVMPPQGQAKQMTSQGMQSQNFMGPPLSFKKPAQPEAFNQKIPAKSPSNSGSGSWAASSNGMPNWTGPSNGMPESPRTHSNSSAESNASGKSVGVEKKENGYQHHHTARPKLEPVITELPSAPGRPNTASDRLNAMLMERFPNSTLEELQICLQEVRHNNNDTLQGIKTQAIIILIEEAIAKRNAKKASKPAWKTVDQAEINWTNMNKDDCCICMEPIEDTKLAELQCKHQFHVHCIRQWLEMESVCPTCMRFTKMVTDYPPLK